MGRDTLENWQSEFLQLLWQVGGLAVLLYVGSPHSGEGDQRQEEKLDAILRAVAPKEADHIIAEIDSHLDRGNAGNKRLSASLSSVPTAFQERMRHGHEFGRPLLRYSSGRLLG